MASPTTLPRTVALSSAQHSGLSFLSAWAPFTTSPPPTILRPMAWWRGVTDSSRTPGFQRPQGASGGPSPAPRRFFHLCSPWRCQAAAHSRLQRAIHCGFPLSEVLHSVKTPRKWAQMKAPLYTTASLVGPAIPSFDVNL